MNILLLGSGGREHALALALHNDGATVVALPGNPGIAEVATVVSGDMLDAEFVIEVAREHEIDLVVIGPEAPLVAGIADMLRDAGFAVFGPGADAARIEGSKAYAKEIMAMADIPTAMARVCRTREEAEDALDSFLAPHVVKDDGLAAGKGVVVTDDRQAALDHALACFEAGGAVVIEEYLDGPEFSLLCISDGQTVIPLAPAQDYKRLRDNNEGPNTGGMGAYSPLPWLDPAVVDETVERVAKPAVSELARQGNPFIGVLYCGLALTSRGLRVIEFNARFGDPETQVVLARLKTPLPALLYSAAVGKLAGYEELEWADEAVVTVVVASEGYPGKVRTGVALPELDGVLQAGTTLGDGGVVTSGGRVLNVMGRGQTVAEARQDAYSKIVNFVGAQWRTDIAAGVA